MSDIAQLGIAIDSSQATKASGALDYLAQIAKNTANTVALLEKSAVTAASAASKLDTASKGAATSVDNIGKSAGTAKSKLDGFASALDGIVGSVRDMSSVGQRGLEEMRAKFDPLYAAGLKYKQTLNDIRDANRMGALTQDQMAAAIMDTKVAFVAQTNTIRGVNGAYSESEKVANVLARAHGNLSTQAMAAQHSIRSMIEGIVLGMPPTQVLGQQLNHLSYAATGPGGLTGAFKQAGGAILGLLSPTTLVLGGIAAITAAGYLAYSSVVTMAKAFDDASRSAETTTNALHGLASAAAFKGIDQGEFLKAMDRFGGSVYNAQHNMGALAEIFRANNQSASTFTDYLEKAANLIKNASTDQQRLQLLQQMGLPATMDWVRFLSQGGDAIKQAAKEAANFGETAEGKMVAKAREFDERWATAWTNFANNSKNAILQAATLLDNINPSKLVDIYKNALRNEFGKPGVTAPQLNAGNKLTANSDVSGFYAGTGAGAASPAKTTVDPNILKNQISLEQQHLGLLGQLGAVSVAVRQAELSIAAARLSGVSVTKQESDALILLAKSQAESTLVQNQASVGVFNLGLANKAAQDTMQSWISRGLLDPKNVEQYAAAQTVLAKNLRATAEAAMVAASNLPQLTQMGLDAGNTFKQLDTFGVSSMNALSSTLVDIGTNSVSAGDGFRQFGLTVLKSLEQMIVQLLIIKPLMSALGFGGGLGSLFGFSSGGFVGPTSVGGAPLGFASGGYTGSGGKFEPAGIVHRGEYVMDAKTTSRIGVGNLDKLRGYASGGYVSGQSGSNDNTPSVTIVNNNDFRGADPGSEARMRQYVDQSSKQAVQQAVQQVATIKGAAPSYLRASR